MNILGYLQNAHGANRRTAGRGLMLGFFDGDCRDKLQGIWSDY